MTTAVVDSKTYIKGELEKIKEHQWEMGVDRSKPVSFSDATEDFKTHPYNLGLTAEDWFHVNAIKDLLGYMKRRETPLNYPFFDSMLERTSGAIEKYWQNVGTDLEKRAEEVH
ncbi:MAG: hypothetical protein AABY22_15390 [Nanoarchaeota archaeon]